jgi:hypothetical protein
LIATVAIINPIYSIEDNSTSNKANITIPAVCDEEECPPQIFVSIPINQTQFNSMSNTELNNLKESYLKSIDNYLSDSFNTIKSYDNKPIKPYTYCDTLPPPGCRGITYPPQQHN